MTSETVRAVEAVKFIAAHLRTEDDYAEVWRRWSSGLEYIRIMTLELTHRAEPPPTLSPS